MLDFPSRQDAAELPSANQDCQARFEGSQNSFVLRSTSGSSLAIIEVHLLYVAGHPLRLLFGGKMLWVGMDQAVPWSLEKDRL